MYDVLVTTVAERADLFIESMESLFAQADEPPSRVLVNEDVRPGSHPGVVAAWLNDVARPTYGVTTLHNVVNPNQGMGCGMRWLFDHAEGEFALYTQEDWKFVRPTPIAEGIRLAHRFGLNHIRFNKRKTMSAKHADTPKPWAKIPVFFADSGEAFYGMASHPSDALAAGQALCVSDHWYTQASIWRVDVARAAIHHVGPGAGMSSEHFVSNLNKRFNDAKDGRAWNDSAMRHERLKTYIWGPVAEPRFIEHLGSRRGTGTIVDHLGEKGR